MRTRTSRHAILSATVAALAALPACGSDEQTPDTPDAPTSSPDAASPDAAPPAPPVTAQILAFNDFHGHLEPPAGSSGRVVTQAGTPPVTVDAGGAAYLAAHIAALRAQEPNTVVVSAGDLIGASPLLSAAYHDEPAIEAMNLIGLDVAGVGNHEFDEGSSELLRMQFGGCHPGDGCQDGTGFPGARFSFLSANVAVEGASERTLFPRYVVKELGGVPVAFIGLTLEGTPSIVTPLGVGGLDFLDEAATVNQIVPALQAAGVHAIVVVVHEGGFQPGLYDACDGLTGAIVDITSALDREVDLVISGHTHAAYNCVVGGTPVTSALSFGRLITQIQLTLDPVTHDVLTLEAHNRIVTRDTPVAAMEALITHYRDLVAPIRDRVVGRTSAGIPIAAAPSGESPMGLLIADAQLDATAAANLGGAQIALMNPGGVRAELDAGDVSFGEIFTVQPFGNSLVTMTLTGAQLEQVLEQQWTTTTARVLQPSQGFTYSYTASAPAGSRVDPASMRLDGVAISPTVTYRVTVNSFLASGGDGFTVFSQGTDRLGGAIDLDALEDYLQAHTPLAPPTTDRITRLP